MTSIKFWMRLIMRMHAYKKRWYFANCWLLFVGLIIL